MISLLDVHRSKDGLSFNIAGRYFQCRPAHGKEWSVRELFTDRVAGRASHRDYAVLCNSGPQAGPHEVFNAILEHDRS